MQDNNNFKGNTNFHSVCYFWNITFCHNTKVNAVLIHLEKGYSWSSSWAWSWEICIRIYNKQDRRGSGNNSCAVIFISSISNTNTLLSCFPCAFSTKAEKPDCSERLQLQKRLGCRNFQWFLSNVYPELSQTEDTPRFSGKVRENTLKKKKGLLFLYWSKIPVLLPCPRYSMSVQLSGCCHFEKLIIQTGYTIRMEQEAKGLRRQTAGPNSHMSLELQPGDKPRFSVSVWCHWSEDPKLRFFRCY